MEVWWKSPFVYTCTSVFWVWRNLNAVIRQRMTAFHGGLSDMVQSLGSRYYVFYLMWAIRGKFYMSWVRCIAFSNKAFLLGNKNSSQYLGHTCKTSIHYYLRFKLINQWNIYVRTAKSIHSNIRFQLYAFMIQFFLHSSFPPTQLLWRRILFISMIGTTFYWCFDEKP